MAVPRIPVGLHYETNMVLNVFILVLASSLSLSANAEQLSGYIIGVTDGDTLTLSALG